MPPFCPRHNRNRVNILDEILSSRVEQKDTISAPGCIFSVREAQGQPHLFRLKSGRMLRQLYTCVTPNRGIQSHQCAYCYSQRGQGALGKQRIPTIAMPGTRVATEAMRIEPITHPKPHCGPEVTWFTLKEGGKRVFPLAWVGSGGILPFKRVFILH